MLLRSLAALACAALMIPVLSSNAHAQGGGVDLDGYCRMMYGGQTRSTMLNQSSAYSWRCATTNGMVSISMEDVCRRQYGMGWRAYLGNERDPYSWKCGR